MQRLTALIAASLTLTIGFALPATATTSHQSPTSIRQETSPFGQIRLSSAQAEIGGRVLVYGVGLNRIARVLLDAVPASFTILSDTTLEFTVPQGVMPGDAVLKLEGESNTQFYQSPLEVVAPKVNASSRITIGTFQGYVAVYTKNLQGRNLRIVIGDRSRQISSLKSPFTQNLTKVGSGKSVRVKVFLDEGLMKSLLMRVE